MDLIDNIWLWGHPAGAHNGRWNLPGESAITLGAAATKLGIRNGLMVAFANEPAPPFAPDYQGVDRLDRLVWSVVGDAATTRNDSAPDTDAVLALKPECPNLCGAIMDDFFQRDHEDIPARMTVAQLAEMRKQLHDAGLELWVVLYDHQLDMNVGPWLELCDTVTFWTWCAEDLQALETNIGCAESLTRKHDCDLILGCYLYDYGNSKPMPVATLDRQAEFGRGSMESGRLDGLIFLASCICDLELDTIPWLRHWLAVL